MKFKLSTVGTFYTVEDAKELEELGFQFGNTSDFFKETFLSNNNRRKYMLTSNIEINISSLEELIEFSNKWGKLIIEDNEIIIYDYYYE